MIDKPRLTEPNFVVLTGLSGSGKSQAIHALEDLGYFCVDNLPTTLMPTLAGLMAKAGGTRAKAAVVMDVREGEFLSHFPKVYKALSTDPSVKALLVFLEASDDALLRRFSETRRPHPLAKGRSPREGIHDERERLSEIRRLADEIIDSSDMTVHDLRRRFMSLAQGGPHARLVLTVLSFGFKYGLPSDADLVLDVRFLPNPHFVPALQRLTGRSRAVKAFLDRHAAMHVFLDKTTDLLEFLVPQYVTEGKSHLTVAIGCTGGRHRSVVVSEALRRRMSALAGVRVRINHRDIRSA